MAKKSLDRWQFGDFQTPDDLAEKVISTLVKNYDLSPTTVIEPSCGKGAFVRAALREFEQAEIIGLDINCQYISTAEQSISEYANYSNAILKQSNFFETDWNTFLSKQSGPLLVIGNPPWVTSSELSVLNSRNIPAKSNFQSRRGIEAITGSGNFDISEWMLLQYVEWILKREGMIAVLCKYSVARKVSKQTCKRFDTRFSSSIYLIDAKQYFNASVEACLFVLSTKGDRRDCFVYKDLDSAKPSYTIGERDGFLLKDTLSYEHWKHLSGQDLRYIWRSGVKHDCSKVMILENCGDNFFLNGLKERSSLEEDYLFPLLKSSDIGNSRTETYKKLVLVTQKAVGQETTSIQQKAPKTWNYLVAHDEYLSNRKSSIYRNKPPYSVFGIGPYTFKPWKVAISALYKRLNFCVVGPLDGKPVVFDDTVNFLSCESKQEALFIYSLLTSPPAKAFLASMIFWDEKRPITIALLRRLSLKLVAQELDVINQYLQFASTTQIGQNGQLALGLSEKRESYSV